MSKSNTCCNFRLHTDKKITLRAWNCHKFDSTSWDYLHCAKAISTCQHVKSTALNSHQQMNSFTPVWILFTKTAATCFRKLKIFHFLKMKYSWAIYKESSVTNQVEQMCLSATERMYKKLESIERQSNTLMVLIFSMEFVENGERSNITNITSLIL